MLMKRTINLLSDMAWGVLPDVLEKWCGILEAKLNGDLGELQAAFGSQPVDEDRLYEVVDGVAVVPVVGSLSKRFFLFSCGTTFSDIRSAVEAALRDPDVQAIMLDVDSPGGTVDGTKELADYLYSVREEKPLYAYADGLMASAAYWIGSAALDIAAPELAQVGSIGVVTAHYDYSKSDEARGIKRTILTAGAYKAMGNDAEPLTAEARGYIQDRLDQIYSVFVNDVARNRGVTVEKALSMADGKVFLGREALKAGLIDRIATKDQFLKRITEDLIMNREEFKTKHPDLYEQVKDEGRSEVTATMNQEKDQAAVTGRAQVLGLVGAIFGDEAKANLEQAVNAGVTPEQFAAMQKLMPKSAPVGTEAQQRMLEAIEKAAAEGVTPAKEVEKDSPESAWEKDEKLRAEFGNDKDRYLSYLRATEDGRVKILSK